MIRRPPRSTLFPYTPLSRFVSDDEQKETMGLLFRELKTAAEPACAASTAALLGPLSGRFSGKKVVTVMCGSNIDWQTFAQHANLGT